MSDNDNSHEQKIPVTPAPPIEQNENQLPTSIDGVKAPIAKTPDKNQTFNNQSQDNPNNSIHGLNKQKQSGVSLAIVVTVVIIIIIAGLVVYAYSKSK